MTEQKIESLMLAYLETATSGLDGVSLQLIGAWQASPGVKALESGEVDGIISVKCFPRTYETPTIPDGSFQLSVFLTMRADLDADGQRYLAVTDAISTALHKWQKSYSDYAADFAVEGEFTPTGYNIESGDCGLDADRCIWTYQATLLLYGIITDPPPPTPTTNN